MAFNVTSFTQYLPRETTGEEILQLKLYSVCHTSEYITHGYSTPTGLRCAQLILTKNLPLKSFSVT